MGRTIRISERAHEHAKRKAVDAGMKLYSFIELAITSFDIRVVMEPRKPRAKRKAG